MTYIAVVGYLKVPAIFLMIFNYLSKLVTNSLDRPPRGITAVAGVFVSYCKCLIVV